MVIHLVNGFDANFKVTFFLSEDEKDTLEGSLEPKRYTDFILPSTPKKVLFEAVSCSDGKKESATLDLDWVGTVECNYPFLAKLNILIWALETQIWWGG